MATATIEGFNNDLLHGGGSGGRIKRLCNSNLTSSTNLPSLPKLHGKSTLVTTKLCEQVFKSITPHIFDLSTPDKHITDTLIEYNSLQDPHLRSYFHHAPRKQKLKKTGFITDQLEVVCSLKKYNAYRHFLEEEFKKIYQQKVEELECSNGRNADHQPVKLNDVTTIEREQKRKQFFEQQERKLRDRQKRLRRLELEEQKAKQQLEEQKKLQRQQAEMKREAELEERKMKKLKEQLEEAFKRKSLIDKVHVEDYLRLLQLYKSKQVERVKHSHELEERWEKYAIHAQQMHEEAERKKQNKEKEKEMNVIKREKLFRVLQKKEDEKKQKILEQNHLQVQQLREEAEKFEKHWKRVQNNQVSECRENMKKQQEHWNLRQRRSSDRPLSGAISNTSRDWRVLDRIKSPTDTENTAPLLPKVTQPPSTSLKVHDTKQSTSNSAVFERPVENGVSNTLMPLVTTNGINNRKEGIVVESVSMDSTVKSAHSIAAETNRPYSSSDYSSTVSRDTSSSRCDDERMVSSSGERLSTSSSKSKAVRFEIPSTSL